MRCTLWKILGPPSIDFHHPLVIPLFMTFPELKKYLSLSDLKQGDIVRHADSGAAYTVLQVVGGVPIVARTLQIHNASEWELVYTTTPVKEDTKPAPPSLVDVISGLEILGWSFNDVTDRWISPDGNFATRILRHAWEVRNNYAKPAPSLTVKGPRPYPFPPVMVQELKDAGWKRVGMKWQERGTHILHSGLNSAWRLMDNAKIEAVTASPSPAVRSFQEAQAALRQAGWVNVAGRVWRAPSGCFFDGAKCAYDAMSQDPFNAS